MAFVARKTPFPAAYSFTLCATLGVSSRHSSGRRRPENTDDHAEDFDARSVGLRDPDRGVVRVFGKELNAGGSLPEPLDRSVVLDEGHDDLSIRGRLTGPDENQIAVQDVGVAHAVAFDPQQKGVIRNPLGRQVEDVFDVLLGQDRSAGRDAAQQRHPATGWYRTCMHRARSRQRTGTTRLALEAALLLERFEVIMDCGRRKTELRADLANGGRKAGSVPVAIDELEDLALPMGQRSHQTNVRLVRQGESRGLALLTALLMLAFFGLVGAALISSASVDVLIADNYAARTRLDYLSETGVDEAREALGRSPLDLSGQLASAAGADGRIETSSDPTVLLASDDGAVFHGEDAEGLTGPAALAPATVDVLLRNDAQDGPDQMTDVNGIVTLVSVARLGDWTRVLEADVLRRVVPVGAALSLNGPATSLGPDEPGVFTVTGTDSCGGVPVHAVGVLGDLEAAAVRAEVPPGRATIYTGLGAMPDIVDGTALQPGSLESVAGLEALAERLSTAATDRFAAPAAIGNIGAPGAPRLVVASDDVWLGPGTGYGILLVRGEARVRAGFRWRGLVLVIGQGVLEWNEGGEVRGALLVARTRSARGPASPDGTVLAQPGVPSVDFSGGAGAIAYDSCLLTEAWRVLPLDVIGYRN